MIIGVLKEPSPETRVSLLPEHIAILKKWNVEVCIENGAGVNAFANDEKYAEAGAKPVSRAELLDTARIILSLNNPGADTLSALKPGTVLLGVYQPLFNPGLMKELAEKGLTVFSMDMLPRTTRAQSMDVLSSQANIAGYKAVLHAAGLFPKYFPMFMTAAGSIPPAKLLILGAGVAGLQAIATGRRLGAVVEVFDTRPAVKEEVMSLGAKFVEVEGAADASKAGGYAVEQTEDFMKRQKAKIAESVAKADIIITTAQIPGRKAPILITTEMLGAMKSGSVIIDLAAATGGNTELTKNNETVMHNGIRIVGNSFLPATMPSDASKLYGKNILNFLQLMITKEGELNLNFEDDLVLGTCITDNQQIVHDRIREMIN
ncbi:MAG: Re/Si-specific NAD(P)(+) transhydrogenase subunit alpha [Ferruginibacter sp.]|nr:Re/Si-specific NAD(P)(+) transhydrogenase subunit alpha [Chitinophagaceae bacterium]MBP6287827.1 Re/Si-specific NAD(P)(+) transhydrogenase subunit alpha [Ferruginibacter sp.]MBU9935996.1 Re/Si-specific NAD(P)(+) transhydrogenase subunit alpha [Ferruginibacter sp.]HQY12963.1 Re/Si-specific NAD(P)(+) transhydrogenase subunit alpha [Ferruginibacter sp.]